MLGVGRTASILAGINDPDKKDYLYFSLLPLLWGGWFCPPRDEKGGISTAERPFLTLRSPQPQFLSRLQRQAGDSRFHSWRQPRRCLSFPAELLKTGWFPPFPASSSGIPVPRSSRHFVLSPKSTAGRSCLFIPIYSYLLLFIPIYSCSSPWSHRCCSQLSLPVYAAHLVCGARWDLCSDQMPPKCIPCRSQASLRSPWLWNQNIRRVFSYHFSLFCNASVIFQNVITLCLNLNSESMITSHTNVFIVLADIKKPLKNAWHENYQPQNLLWPTEFT